jgi:hypothetical protein
VSCPGPVDDAVLPGGVRSRFLDDVNGLRVHVLEAGQAANPCVLLLHGFPELAYSWRNVMPGLADAGFHVVAPDMRAYGRTTGGDIDYDGDLRGYYTLNVVCDALGVIWASLCVLCAAVRPPRSWRPAESPPAATRGSLGVAGDPAPALLQRKVRNVGAHALTSEQVPSRRASSSGQASGDRLGA